MEVIKGIPVAPGVSIGRAFVLEEVLERVPHHVVADDQVEVEIGRLEAAWSEVKADLESDRARAAEKLGPRAREDLRIPPRSAAGQDALRARLRPGAR